MLPEYLKNIVLYRPGKPIEELQRELGLTKITKLASNENPLGPPEEVVEHLKQLKTLSRYPDAQGYALRKRLSELHQWPMEGILLGNGSEEIIAMVNRAFAPGQEVLVSAYGFAIFRITANQAGAQVKAIPEAGLTCSLDNMARHITSKTAVIFLANPNNPTGTFLPLDQLEAFIADLPPQVLMVVDEAYFEYVEDPQYDTALKLIKKGYRLLVTRTFSKIYGMATLRLGYCIGPPEIIQDLRKVKLPFNCNGLAQSCGIIALSCTEHLQRSRDLNRREKKRLKTTFQKWGIPLPPTHTNFILLPLPGDSQPYYEKLLHRGVITRPLHEYNLPNYLRVTVGLPEENNHFLDAFGEIWEKDYCH